MADLVISRRAVGVSLPAGIVAIAVTATIGYNLGFGSDAKLASPVASPGSPAAPVEIPVAGEPVTVAGKTILSGTVCQPSTTGFTLDVTTQILNTQTRRLTPKTTSYHVVLNKSTQVVQQTSTITVPYAGAVPRVSSSTKTASASAIKADSKVTVTTKNPATNSTVTALEVWLTTVVRK